MPVEFLFVDIFLIRCAMSVKLETSHDDFLLLQGQELGMRRGVGHEEQADNSVNHGNSPLDEENPVMLVANQTMEVCNLTMAICCNHQP